ncbi:MAG: hypothetical protein HYU28_06050 [Actinobacteria bacterium]|nr:hypothetical protein [Actinomycetota bacterium]
MTRTRNRTPKLLVAALLVIGFLTATYGLTAANTVPASKAGDGSGAVSGYTVSAIDYTLIAADPTKVDKVDFSLDTAPAATSQIRAKIDGAWHSCTNVAAAVTCDFASGSEPTVAGATSLQVVVAD